MSLIEAAKEGDLNEVLALLEGKSVDPNKANWEGTPLHIAASNGHKDVVDALLACKDVNRNKADCGGSTPLFSAARLGKKGVVDSLLTCEDVDRNKANSFGMTPLYVAAQDGRKDVVDALLACEHVDRNKANIWGGTPLFVAAKGGHKDVVGALLDCKDILPSVGTRDRLGGQGPFEIASKHRRLIPIIQKWERTRFASLCIAFRPLDLPLLQLLLIIEWDAVQLGYAAYLPSLHVQWERGKLIRMTPMLS